ncbi:MAG: hypothetical protein ACREVN_00515 [Gammaproteobacteria bacterium]
MHIVLGILATIVTILILLHRLADAGIDLGGLNPFLWHRRRNWRKKYEGSPLYALDSPMEAAALLVVATGKCDGEISAEQKKAMLGMFEAEFHLSPRDASALLGSSAHLLATVTDAPAEVAKILARSRERFTAGQSDSTIALMERLAEVEGGPTAMQRELIEAVRSVLSKDAPPVDGKWSQDT